MKQELTNKEIDRRFGCRVLSEEANTHCIKIQEAGKRMAKLINKSCPDSREKSLAFTKIEEAVMWALASIVSDE